MSERIITYFGHTAGAEEYSNNFFNYYKRISGLKYSSSEDKISKVYFGKQREVCCLCLQTTPNVTFKNESHVIPSSLGNKTFFSNEECDDCNQKFGTEIDQHLALMTEPDRVLYSMQSRNAPPKIIGNGTQFQYIQNQGFSVILGSDLSNSPISFSEEEKKISVKLPAKSFVLGKAIRALFKSTWLILPLEKRKYYNVLLKHIVGEHLDQNYCYFHGQSINNDPQEISIEVYERTSKIHNLPALIIQFKLAHLHLILPIPSIPQTEKNALIIPPIRSFIEHPRPSGELKKLSGWEDKNIPMEKSFVFNFSNVEKGGPRTLKKPFKHNSTEIVNLTVTHGDQNAKIHGLFATLKNQGSSHPQYQISSPNYFTLKLSLDTNNRNSANITFDLKPANKRTRDVLAACSFLHILANPGAVVEVLWTDSGQRIEFISNGYKDAVSEVGQIAKFMTSLGNFVGQEIKYPKRISKKDRENLLIAYQILSESKINQSGSVDFSLPYQPIESIFKKPLNESEISIRPEPSDLLFSFLPHPIKLPLHEVVTRELHDMRYVEESDQLKISIKFSYFEYKLVAL